MDESGDDDEEEELTVVAVVATVVSELNDDDADTTALEAAMDTDNVSLSGALRDLLLEFPRLLRPLPLLSTALSLVPQIEPAHVMLLPILMLVLVVVVFLLLLMFLLSPAPSPSGWLLFFNAMAPQKEEPDCRCCFFPSPPLLIFLAAVTASIGEEELVGIHLS